MKRTVSKILACAAAVTCLACTACNPADSGKDKESDLMKYSEIYAHKDEKSPALTGKALYKASYGYTLSKEQGYNNFYYRYNDGGEKDMTLSGDIWTGGGAKMDGGVMKATADTGAVRVFRCPAAGSARVYGNPKLVSGAGATVGIYDNDTKIAEWTVDTAEGIWHDQTLALTAGHELKFIVKGDAEIYWNPTVDYTLAEEVLLHHTADGDYGDVHPYYDRDSGKLYMFYLSTGRNQLEYVPQFTSLATVSSDFVHYEPVKIGVSSTNPPEQSEYFVLGVIKDKHGIYRSSYGKYNYAGCDMSRDLLTWEGCAKPYVDESDGLMKYTYRAYFTSHGAVWGRDPDLFYNPEDDKIYCVVMNYYTDKGDKGEKWLTLYTADGDGKFTDSSARLLDFTGKGDPECPQLKKIGDRWYLFYSQYGTGVAGNVGLLNYRMGDKGVTPDQVDWASKPEYALDGGDIHAAQLTEVGGRYYMYGWMAGAIEANYWGGPINLAREVYVRSDGTLATRCDEYFTKLLNKGLAASFDKDSCDTDGASFDNGDIAFEKDGGTVTLNREQGRSLLFAHIECGADGDAVFRFEAGGGVYTAGVVSRGGKRYLEIKNVANGVNRVVEMDNTLTSFDLKIIADGKFLEAFVNDEYSVTAHTFLKGDYKISLSAANGTKVSGARVCKLSDYNNIFD